MKRALTLVLVLCAIASSPSSQAQQPRTRVSNLEELRWPDIDAFDRERTVFILPMGMLEEHGPHLPIGADTFGITFEASSVARRVARAFPQWHVVMMPAMPYGEAGANLIGGHLVHPGTYGIRQSTLRALVADVGAQVARNRFKWVFVLTGHAAPPHNIAINEACDFVSETFGITMLHVSGIFRADETMQVKGREVALRYYSPSELSSFGVDIHAGVTETSGMLALRPDLVHRGYKKLAAQTGHTREALEALARAPGWPGYLSSPAKATAAYGRAVEEWWIDGMTDLVLRALKGENLFDAPRAPGVLDPPVASLVRQALEDEDALDATLREWLARRSPKR